MAGKPSLSAKISRRHLSLLTVPSPSANPGTSLRPTRPEAALVAWPWQAQSAVINPAIRVSALRREGVLRGAIGLIIGTALYFWKPPLAYVAWSLSGVVLFAALVSPGGFYAAIGRGLARFGEWVGRFLAVVLLTPVFFLFFLPFGRLTRWGKRDKLERWFDRAAPSYWHRRNDPPRDRAFYEKAF